METSADIKRETLIRYKRAVLNAINNAKKVYKNQLQQLGGGPADSDFDNAIDLTNTITARAPTAIPLNTVHAIKPNDSRLASNNSASQLSQPSNPVQLGPIHEKPILKPIPLPIITDLPMPSNSATSAAAAVNSIKPKKTVDVKGIKKEGKTPTNQQLQLATDPNAQQLQRSVAATNEMTRRKDTGLPIKPSPIPSNIINSIQTLNPEGVHSYPPMILPRVKGHWDYLIDEVQYISLDYRQDLRWKLDQAKTIAMLCAEKVIQIQLKKQQNIVNEDRISALKGLASKISSSITQYWESVRDEIIEGIDSDRGLELLVTDMSSKDSVVTASVSTSADRIQPYDKLIVDSIVSLNNILVNVTSTDTIKSGVCYVNSNVGCGITLCGRGVVGKTVIASSIVHEWVGKATSNHILIVSSYCNIVKWQKCLQSVVSNNLIKIWDRTCVMSDGGIVVVPAELLASFVKRVYKTQEDSESTPVAPVVFNGVIIDSRGINSGHMTSSFRSIDASCSNWIAQFSSYIPKTVHNRLLIHSKGEISVEAHGLVLPFLFPQLYDHGSVFDWSTYVGYCKALNASDRVHELLRALTINVGKYAANEVQTYSEEVVYVELAPNQAYKYHKFLNYLIDLNHFDGNNAHCLMMGLILLNRICFHASLVNLEIGAPTLSSEVIENESKVEDAMMVEDEGIYGQLSSVHTLPTSDTGIISFCPVILSNITSPSSSIFHNIPGDSAKLHKLAALLVQHKHKNVMVMVANNEQKVIVQHYLSSLDKSVVGHRLYYCGSSIEGDAVDALSVNDITFNSKLPYCLVLARPVYESLDLSCQYCDVVINLSIEWFSKTDYLNKYPNTKNSVKVINVAVKNCWDDIFYRNNNSFVGIRGSEILQLHNSVSTNSLRSSKRFLGGIHSSNIDENSAFVAKIIKCYDALESDLNSNLQFSICYSLDQLVALCPSSNTKSPTNKRVTPVVVAPYNSGQSTSQDLKLAMKLKLVASRVSPNSVTSAPAKVGVACHILNVLCNETKAAKNEELRQNIFNEYVNNVLNNTQVHAWDDFKRRFGFGLSEAEKQFWNTNIPSLEGVTPASAEENAAPEAGGDWNISVSSYAGLIPEFKRFGDHIDEYMLVNPLQTSQYIELMYNPTWQNRSSRVEEELSVTYTSKAYKSTFGKSNGYVFDRSSVDGVEKSRKRLMVEYGNLLEDKRVKLESKVASRSARLSVYNPHSTAMLQITKIPLTRGSRECDMTSEPWSQREDNIIIAVQIINPFDLSFGICELLFNLYIPEALGKIRSKKQCKERYNQLLSQGKVDPTDPDIVSCVNSLREILHIPAVTAPVPVVKPVKEETNEMVTITSPRTTSNSIMSSALLNDTFKLARVILQYNTDIANNKVTKILSKDNIIDNLTTTLPALTPLQILLS